ncbi:MAG TPA: extracellular solute-binding protein [Anaerolineae bacterium]|nr:extracellular solute-binding protein [Anaerolineae bacterium]
MILRVCVFLSLAILTACRPAVAPGAPDSITPVNQTIILWHSAEGDVRRALLAQIDEFNATNAWNIVVVPEYHGRATDVSAALQKAIAAGRTPDMVLGRPLDALRLGDAVAPVQAYAIDKRYGLSQADLADLYPAALDANRDPRLDANLISFPVAGEGSVLVYNIDRLAAAGYLTPPNSWPLFKEICLVTTLDRDGDRQPDVFGFGFAPRPDLVSAWFRSRGAPLLGSDGLPAEFSGEPGIKLLTLFSESAQAGCFYRTPGANDDVEAFSAGRVAMIFASTSALRDIQTAVENRGGFRWGAAPLPYGNLPRTLDLRGPAWIMLHSTSEKQLAAWLFMRWFATTDQTLVWAMKTGQLPLRASAAQRLRQQSGENPNYLVALDLLRFGQADPLVPYWPGVAEAARQAMLAVAAGDTPAVAHQQALNAINQLLAP